nr:MAG TPA: peptidase [Bacteriophage sp.]
MKHYNKYIPTALTILSSVGVVATAVTTSRATLKAKHILDDKFKDVEFENKKIEILTKLKAILPTVAVPTVIGVATIISIILTNRYNQKEIAKLTASCALLSSSYKKYKDAIKEVISKEDMKKVDEILARKSLESKPKALGLKKDDEIYIIDSFTGSVMVSTYEKALEGIKEALSIYHDTEEIAWCDISYLINGSLNAYNSQMGSEWGWSRSMMEECIDDEELEITLKKVESDSLDGEVYKIDYNYDPQYGYYMY